MENRNNVHNSDVALEIRDLWVRFETDDANVYAVNGLNLKLNRSSTLGLVGETGAGKTTTVLSLLKLISSPPGVISAESIMVNGRDVMKMTDKELQAMRGDEIAMIFQDPMTSLNPVMTVGEQIAESIILHNEVTAEEAMDRAKEMLEAVGISGDRAGEYPHQFSGGMKQRVVIAIALACHPSILIADEPTTALDVTIQAQVLDMMQKLKEEFQTSMILITHDLGIVAECCDEVAVMYAGSIVEKGTLEEVFEHTKHPYTEGLFNSLPDLNDRTHVPKPIKGLIPDPTIVSSGCTFADRCPYAIDRCFNEYPSESWSSDTHMCACHRYEESDFRIERGSTV